MKVEFHCYADCLEIGTSTLLCGTLYPKRIHLPSIVSVPIVPNSTVSSPTDEPIVSEHTPVNSLNAVLHQSQQQPGESTSPCLPLLENK